MGWCFYSNGAITNWENAFPSTLKFDFAKQHFPVSNLTVASKYVFQTRTKKNEEVCFSAFASCYNFIKKNISYFQDQSDYNLLLFGILQAYLRDRKNQF